MRERTDVLVAASAGITDGCDDLLEIYGGDIADLATVHTDRKHGTGLGLALVRLVARAHGGDVQVHSVPGRTVFTVTLPAAP